MPDDTIAANVLASSTASSFSVDTLSGALADARRRLIHDRAPVNDRDRRNRHELSKAGWRVAVVWECALRKGGEAGTAVELHHWLRGNGKEFETNPGS